MNTERLKFINPGDAICESKGKRSAWRAEIHVVGFEVWLSRIQVYGATKEDAEALRERLLFALSINQDKPDLFQYKSKHGEMWHNCDGGEAAKAQGEGYEIRALFLRARPPKED